VCMVLGFFYL